MSLYTSTNPMIIEAIQLPKNSDEEAMSKFKEWAEQNGLDYTVRQFRGIYIKDNRDDTVSFVKPGEFILKRMSGTYETLKPEFYTYSEEDFNSGFKKPSLMFLVWVGLRSFIANIRFKFNIWKLRRKLDKANIKYKIEIGGNYE